MAPKFPSDIYTPRATENLPGIVYDATKKQNLFSEDFQNLGGEINAIESTLGENPQGAYATVLAWLTALASAITGKQNSLGFTPENVANKKIVLTDNSDTFYPSQKAVKTAVDAKADASSVPVKATGAEITTGANDTKFVTPKAMADAGVNVPSGGGGSSVLLSIKKVFSVAEMRSSHSSPVVFIPAPGAGKYINLHNFWYKYTYVSPVYTGGGISQLVWHGSTSPIFGRQLMQLYDWTGSANIVPNRATVDSSQDGRFDEQSYTTQNNSIDFYTATADVASGNGYLTIYAEYSIVEI